VDHHKRRHSSYIKAGAHFIILFGVIQGPLGLSVFPRFHADLRPRGEAAEWEETRAAVAAAAWKWFHLPARDTETTTATVEAVHGWLIARSVAHLGGSSSSSSSRDDGWVWRAAVIHSALTSNEARCAALRRLLLDEYRPTYTQRRQGGRTASTTPLVNCNVSCRPCTLAAVAFSASYMRNMVKLD